MRPIDSGRRPVAADRPVAVTAGRFREDTMTDPGNPSPRTPDDRPEAAAQAAPAAPGAQPSPPAPGSGAPHPGYAAPPQGYPAPAQGYAAPGQGYTGPPQGYAAPNQAYAAPGQGYGRQPGSGDGRGLGIVAIVVGIVPVLIGGIQPFVLQAIYRSGGITAVELISFGGSLLSLLLAAAAILLGAFAARRPGSTLLGGIGIGLGVGTVISVLLSFLASVAAYV